MRNAKLWLITVFFMLGSLTGIQAQQKKPAPVKKSPVKTTPAKNGAVKTPTTKKPSGVEEKRDEKDDQAKVKDMVAFLEFMLNTLGSSTTSARDKEVLVTQSYSKVFRDGKVQVEDDLDADRTVTTNKDIIAYLKDVDFFFTDVKFEFVIDEIKSGVSANDRTFYKVSIKRNLKGTTTDGKEVNNTIPRYIEVNYDADAQDLKIVSIYTHEVNEKDALINWWKELSVEWKSIFRKKLNLTDSVAYGDMRSVAALTEIDLSNNSIIQNIEPLARLVKLKTLTISNTGVADVSPLRNLTELSDIDFSKTKITDLTPLKYCDKVSRLSISHTEVSDLTVLQKMPAMTWLDISYTKVKDLEPLSGLTALQYINLSHTKLTDLTDLQQLTQLTELTLTGSSVQTLEILSGFKQLTTLTIDSTGITILSPLSGAENLKVLNANATRIAEIKPLQKLTHLERIYADHTQIRKEIADAFIAGSPKVLVIYNSEDLNAWWSNLGPAWQETLSKAGHVSATPSKEELAKLPLIDSINVSGIIGIRDLEPLSKLIKLKYLKADKTSIAALDPLKDHTAIVFLDFSDTQISDITVTKQFTRLKTLRADRSKVQSLAPLENIASLKLLSVDETEIHDITAREFLDKNHSCLLIYKTIHLNRWWRKMPEGWKTALRTAMGSDTTASSENLHRLTERESLTIKDAGVNELNSLGEFVRLKNLDFSGTAITDLAPISNMATLRSLHATNGPLQIIESLSKLTELTDLDISNTPVDDLRVIATLENLTKFNCGGTQIKRLDALEKVQHLDYLDCSNTKVGNLDGVSYLPLKTLKCYNTKISARQIENYKKSNPECSVVYYR